MNRFGTMFFDDPIDAFTNIGRALCPSGRLVMMVWQGPARNEWDVAIRHCLESIRGEIADSPGGAAAFSLAERQFSRHRARSIKALR